MASVEELQSAFMKAHEAGDTANAQILATHLKSMLGESEPIQSESTQAEPTINGEGGLDVSISRNTEQPLQQYPEGTALNAQGTPIDIPTDGNLSLDVQRVADQNQAIDDKSLYQTVDENIMGGLEAGATLATGATTGILGMTAGALQGFGKALYNKFAKGEKWNPDLVEKEAMKAMQAVTYAPKTEKGQEFAKAIGETIQPLEALTPMASQIGVLGRGATATLPAKLAKQTNAKTAQVNSAKQAGIDVMTSDVIKPDTMMSKAGQSIMERIPLAGTGGMRVKQQKQRVSAIKDLFNQYGGGELINASDDVMKSLSKKYGDDVAKYTNMKVDVIDRLDNGVVDSTKINKSIDNAIAGLDEVNVGGTLSPIAEKLTAYKEAFNNKSLSTVEKLRKQLGEELSDPSVASGKKVSEKQFNKIYSAVNESMGDFIKQNGERKDFAKWQIANKRLAEGMKTTRKTALKNILEKGEFTPELVDRFLFSKKRSEIELLSKNLTKEGKSNARIAIIQKIADDVGIENISPEIFLRKMKQHNKSVDVFFKGADKQQVSGLIEALNITRQASKAPLHTSTGQQLYAPVMASLVGQMTGATTTSVAVLTGVGLLGKAYESRVVRNSLIKLSNSKTQGAKRLAYNSFINALEKTEAGLLAIESQRGKNETTTNN